MLGHIEAATPAARNFRRDWSGATVAGSMILSFCVFFAPPSWCQNSGACPPCSNWCGSVCLDGMTCANGQPIQCSGGDEPYCPTSPIIVDFLGQGFHLTGVPGGVKFTFNGELLQTSWTDEKYSNAWLALDRNGNGLIDDASELFGEFAPQPPSAHPNGSRRLLCSTIRGTAVTETAGSTPVTPFMRVYSSGLTAIMTASVSLMSY